MADKDDNPRPEKSGSAGSQGSGPMEGEVLTAGEMSEGYSTPLAKLIVDNPKIFGSYGQTALLQSIIRNLESTVQKLSSDKETAQLELRDARELCIRLRSDLRNERQTKKVNILCVTLGVGLVSQCKNAYDVNAGLGVLAGFAGVALLVVGLVRPSDKE